MKRLLFIAFISLLVPSCTYDQYDNTVPVSTGYPSAVEGIIVGKCATAGCHNTISKDAAAGLDLSNWDAMFNGTNNGAVVIPYRSDYSTLCYFTNVDSSLGLVVQPTMPVNGDPISTSEYTALRDWINAGAPNVKGEIKFADDPLRHKFYVVNQGCDVAYVFDGNSRKAMRVIDIGIVPGASPAESPHNVKVTPDGKYWLVVFLNSNVVQVYSTETDQLVMNIPIGNGISGAWNTLVITKDSKKAYIPDYNNGRVAFVDLVAGTSTTTSTFPITGASIPALHGVALNKTEDTLYITAELTSRILKIPVNDLSGYDDVNLNPLGNPWFTPHNMNPHEIIFSPDYTKYFVTCQDSNVRQVRVYNTSDDQLIAAIDVGRLPLEFGMSPSNGLLFVTNTEDNYFPDMKGSISVIDMNTLTEIKRIKVGWQPHGIAVDEKKGIVWIANRNVSGGPAPHHTTACAGKNGYLSAIDIATLEKIADFRPEVSVDPYGIAVRAK